VLTPLFNALSQKSPFDETVGADYHA
jgi:hypothetical protein